ncbi:unnamed protein product [Oikopleura dioica]|uniref:Uncharacterized protein n=1 Tax=Oikopleura dioica TaxID=34765 RepID=E4X8R1_OIKDI|nr:unnamed protein product [Oikopleura dioica]
MGCGASKEVVEEEIKEERRREKHNGLDIHLNVPIETPKEVPAPPLPPQEPLKIIVEQPIHQPPPPVVQPPHVPEQLLQQPSIQQQQPAQQLEPQYNPVPSTMGVSLEDLSDKICLIEQNIQLQIKLKTQKEPKKAIAANQSRAEQNQLAALPPAQPQLAIQAPPPPQQPQIVQVSVPYQVPVPYQIPVTPHKTNPGFDNAMMPSSQTDNMTSAVLEQHLAKLKREQDLLIRDLNRIKRHGHYDPNSFKVRSILSYIENQQKAINQLESAVSAASFAENDFTDFSFPNYSQPAAQHTIRPQTMNYKANSGHWNANAALPPVGNTQGPYGSMYSQQGNPNVQRMEIKTPQNPHQNLGYPGFY